MTSYTVGTNVRVSFPAKSPRAHNAALKHIHPPAPDVQVTEWSSSIAVHRACVHGGVSTTGKRVRNGM